MTSNTPSWDLISPAKLNLMLHIVGKRPDGYHNLQTLFQILDYGDQIRITPNDTGDITLSNPIPGVNDDDNLIIRAARLLQTTTGCKKGATLGVTKLLPMGGGLGGGSSNAATTLLGLNALWGTGLDIPALSRMGLALGADVPLFVTGQSAWAEGVGEQLSPVQLKEHWYLVLFPQVTVHTGLIFSHPDLTRNTPITTIRTALEGNGHNDCEPVVRRTYPAVDEAMRWLNQYSQARLTGTGSCVFGAFDSKEAADQCKALVPGTFASFVARGVNHSPLLQQINMIAAQTND